VIRRRGIFAIVLAILLAGLTPIAYADPPDPTWMGGYWDDDDFDTVVDVITSVSAVSAPPRIDAGLQLVPGVWFEPTETCARSGPPLTFACPRAPPASLSPDS
jgi:hypothetical protein